MFVSVLCALILYDYLRSQTKYGISKFFCNYKAFVYLSLFFYIVSVKEYNFIMDQTLIDIID